MMFAACHVCTTRIGVVVGGKKWPSWLRDFVCRCALQIWRALLYLYPTSKSVSSIVEIKIYKVTHWDSYDAKFGRVRTI